MKGSSRRRRKRKWKRRSSRVKRVLAAVGRRLRFKLYIDQADEEGVARRTREDANILEGAIALPNWLIEFHSNPSTPQIQFVLFSLLLIAAVAVVLRTAIRFSFFLGCRSEREMMMMLLLLLLCGESKQFSVGEAAFFIDRIDKPNGGMAVFAQTDNLNSITHFHTRSSLAFFLHSDSFFSASHKLLNFQCRRLPIGH